MLGMEPKFTKYKKLIELQLEELTADNALGQSAQKTVELDQQSVGRLSRMDALQSQAMAQAQQRRKSKGKSDEASKQSSDSSEMPMTDEHKAFIGIFGEGKRNKGDQMTANRVLLDYAAKFPKGAKANTKKRGSDFLLTNYMQAKGIAMRKRTRSSRPKMDYEAFVMEMKNRRG